MSETLPSLIAIDGRAGVGKTSIATALSDEFGHLVVDSGAFYRAAAWLELKAPARAAVDPLAGISLAAGVGYGRRPVVLFGDRDITAELWAADVDAHVPVTSAQPAIRTRVGQACRQAVAGSRAIITGRDVGAVVFPQAASLFLTCEDQERLRRLGADPSAAGPDALVRDRLESTLLRAQLAPPARAIIIDTTNLTISEASNAARSALLMIGSI